MTCEWCEEKIQGDYITVDGKHFCSSCFKEINFNDLVDIFDLDKSDLMDLFLVNKGNTNDDKADILIVKKRGNK